MPNLFGDHFPLAVVFVIRGVIVSIPHALGRHLVKLLILLRLRDPPKRPSASMPLVITTDSTTSVELDVELDTLSSATALNKSSTDIREEDTIQRKLSIVLDLRTIPVIAVLVLLATRTISIDIVRLGIVGKDGVRPYNVLVLFISLAYISTALDATGGLRYLAFLISQKASSVPKLSPPGADKIASGKKLYALLYWFWFVIGVFVGNDPIVLSGTAFLASLTQITGITVPTAWIYSQFYAANIASAVLVSSNPTNVLIAGAFNLNFLTGYTKYTILPALITSVIAFPLMYFTFTYLKPPRKDINESFRPSREYIPTQLVPPDVAPRSVLVDPSGAIFHSSLMTITLLLLVGISFLHGIEVWMITAPAGIVALARDLISDLNVKKSVLTPSKFSRLSLPSLVNSFAVRFPTTSSIIFHLPLSLLPFTAGIFILAQSLTALGWTSIFSSWVATICSTPTITVFFLGYFIAIVMCPLCGTNIGATILMVEILTNVNFMNSTNVMRDPRILKGAIFSTAVASNFGAMSWSFSSSLAGLLWISILRQKGILVRGKDFAFWNLLFLPALSTIASCIILLQLFLFQ